MARKLKAKAINPDLSGIGSYITIPSGTTAQRPASPAVGMIRYNTDLGNLEQYTPSGWGSIAPPPAITSVSPLAYNGAAGTAFTINGSAFGADAIVKFITSSGTEYTASSLTRVSQSQLIATTPQIFLVSDEPLAIKIIQGSGSITTAGLIDCGGIPNWNTAAGTIATIFDKYDNYSPIVTLSATDPEGTSVTYNITSGALPAGTTLNTANGQITGDPNDVSAQTTSTFTVVAADSVGNTSSRQFNIVVNPGIVTSGRVMDLNAKLTASYPGTGTTWTDLSGSGLNGTLSNVTYSPSYGGVMQFNGTSSKVTFPNITISNTNYLSVDIWFNSSNSSAYQDIIDLADSYGLWITTNSGSVRASFNTGGTTLSTAYSANTWYHLVFVGNGGTATLYMNGSSVGSNSQTVVNNLNFNTARIGNVDGDRASEYFAGSIGSVMIYNRALSQTEVTTNFNASRAKYGI